MSLCVTRLCFPPIIRILNQLHLMTFDADYRHGTHRNAETRLPEGNKSRDYTAANHVAALELSCFPAA